MIFNSLLNFIFSDQSQNISFKIHEIDKQIHVASIQWILQLVKFRFKFRVEILKENK